MEFKTLTRGQSRGASATRRRSWTRKIGVAGSAIAAVVATTTVMDPARAELTGVGPVDAAGHGYPLWYEDENGLRLDLCLDGPPMCLEGLVNPALPATVDNMPEESFWWTAEAAMDLPSVGGDALLVLAQEAAWLNEVPEAGQNMSFARVRIRVTGLTAGETYTVTHPFGVDTFVAEDAVRNINFTEDIGCAAAPCDVTLALQGRVGPFLTWDPAVPPAAPAGFIGNPGVEHEVTGSPLGTNFFRITGPGLPAGGVQTDRFAVQGKLATGAQPTPDLLATSDSGRSDVDNVTRVAVPTFGGFVDPDSAGGTVEILVDGAVAGSAAATGTSYRVTTAALTPGTHRVRARLAGSTVASNALLLRVDPAAPRVTGLKATPNPFNMNRARFTRVTYGLNEAADARASIVKNGRVVKSFATRRVNGRGNVLQTWNGTNNRNGLVRPGQYAFRTVVTDVAGNRSAGHVPIRVIR